MGVSLEIGIFRFQTIFGCFGGCGGLGICCGPEIIGLCVSGVVLMYGLARGEGVSVLMGLMCCLLHLNL